MFDSKFTEIFDNFELKLMT